MYFSSLKYNITPHTMNNIQSEAELENTLIKQLENLEYDFVTIKDEKAMLENLKSKLEDHNFKTL